MGISTNLLENAQVVFISWNSEDVFIVHPSNSDQFSSQWISFYSTMILFSPSLRHQSFSFLFIYSKPFTRSFSDLKPEIFFRADFSLSILCYYHTFSHTCFFPSFLLEKNHKAPSWPSSLWSPSSRPSFLHYHRSILATSQGKMCTASTYGPNVPDFSAFSSILLLTVSFLIPMFVVTWGPIFLQFCVTCDRPIALVTQVYQHVNIIFCKQSSCNQQAWYSIGPLVHCSAVWCFYFFEMYLRSAGSQVEPEKKRPQKLVEKIKIKIIKK